MTNHRQLLSYFNPTELPFTKETPVDQLHLLPSVERNLAAAQLLVDTRGIGAITGKPGVRARLNWNATANPPRASISWSTGPSTWAGAVIKCASLTPTWDCRGRAPSCAPALR